MALSAQQVADLKDKWQYFTCQFVAFSPISFAKGNIPAAGAITWQPFCLLSPRFAFTTGASVVIYGTDSYTRPTTAVNTVTFSKASGDGTVTDNGDKTCTVSYPGGESTGVTVVEAVATDAGAQTATGYAYVYYDANVGNLDAIAARIDGFSGSLETGEWKADMVLRGDYSAVLTNDGRDQPILMHVNHYWDGSASTFGGYKRDENTFVLLCREATIHTKHSGEYETILRLETPAYVLKQTLVDSAETRFSTSAGAGIYSTANLTPTDVSYFLLREGSNLHQYFNISLWNNASTIDNFVVRDKANLWEACRSTHQYNFGMLYFNRWSNLNGKPDPRIRYAEWAAIQSEVYDTNNPLTTAHMLEYNLHRRRTDQIDTMTMQAVLPDMTILESTSSLGASLGDTVVYEGLVAKDAAELGTWIGQYIAMKNTEYEIDMVLPMGHELNPGDLFIMAEIDPPIGDTLSGQSTWFVDDAGYEFDFARGFWVRKLHATMYTAAPA